MKLMICLTLMTPFIFGFSNTPSQPMAANHGQPIFSGEVVAIGPPPGFGSGGITTFQLIKYRINEVCEGNLPDKEIVVDHVMLDGHEFDDLKIGDKVCVGVIVRSAKDMELIWIDGVIRKENEVHETYYLGLDVFIRNCQCSSKK